MKNKFKRRNAFVDVQITYNLPILWTISMSTEDFAICF